MLHRGCICQATLSSPSGDWRNSDCVRGPESFPKMGSGGMMLQYTTPMEAFFALYIFAFSFIMMVGANPQYDYSFLQDYKVSWRPDP